MRRIPLPPLGLEADPLLRWQSSRLWWPWVSGQAVLSFWKPLALTTELSLMSFCPWYSITHFLQNYSSKRRLQLQNPVCNLKVPGPDHQKSH
jgi:hypothetical protein